MYLIATMPHPQNELIDIKINIVKVIREISLDTCLHQKATCALLILSGTRLDYCF